ncbi:MAG: hypothetical protein WC081_03195 [Candidatus Ratteibacteria bacterium]|jgi:Tfp pilus assembly protein PilN
MININLLPPELSGRKSKAPVKTTPDVIFMIAGLIVFLMLILGVKFKSDCRKEKLSLAGLSSALQEIQPEAEKIKKMKEEIGGIQKKMAPLVNDVNNRIIWSEIFNQTESILPKTVWLNQLVLEQRQVTVQPTAPAKAPVKNDSPQSTTAQLPTELITYLVIDGSAYSNNKKSSLNAVADFMNRLGQNDCFTKNFDLPKMVSLKGRKIARTEKYGNKVGMYEITDFKVELNVKKKDEKTDIN